MFTNEGFSFFPGQVQIDKCTIPSKLLMMRRRNSLRDLLPRSPSDPDLAGAQPSPGGVRRGSGGGGGDGDGAGADRRLRRGSALPSMQLRRWKKLGRVMGVAFGMREISRSTKCSSDPELVRMQIYLPLLTYQLLQNYYLCCTCYHASYVPYTRNKHLLLLGREKQTTRYFCLRGGTV